MRDQARKTIDVGNPLYCTRVQKRRHGPLNTMATSVRGDINIETTRGTWEKAEFSKNTKVQDVIQAVVQHFGFAEKGNYCLLLKGNPDKSLALERTFASYGIKDGDTLVFFDLGGGV